MRAFYFLALGIAMWAGLAQAAEGYKPAPVPPKVIKRAESVPGQYVVQLTSERALMNTALLESRLGGKIIDHVRPDMIVIQRPVGQNAMATVQSLSKLPEVQIIEPNYIFHASMQAPNDPDFSKSWGLNNTGLSDKDGTAGLSGIDISIEKAWDIQKGSKKVLVAVVDTGINYKHPDLAKNIWTNEAEANGKTGVDDDSNGYVDDIHGYNFNTNTGDPMDDNGHGSHCAGVIGAEPNNGIGTAGINWDVSLMAVKFLDASGGGTLEDAVKAIDYARKNHAMIMSNSWGGQATSDILKKAVSDTNDAGILFVAAAGNDGADNDQGTDDVAVSIPAGYTFPNVLAVAAVNDRGELADFSNFGAKTVALAAPGVNVYSTFLNSDYETLSGTSMAAPHASGVAALVLAQNPSMKATEVKQRLIDSARPVAGLSGRVVSGGIVNAYYALSNEKPPADPNDPSVWMEKVKYPLSTVHPYANSFTQSYTISEPGAKRLAIHFAKFETENGYDKVEFVDKKGTSLGTYSGVKSGLFSPVANGDTITMKFTSDGSYNKYGFDVDSVSVER